MCISISDGVVLQLSVGMIMMFVSGIDMGGSGGGRLLGPLARWLRRKRSSRLAHTRGLKQ